MRFARRDYRILLACVFCGTVRRAFTHRVFDAWSCDLLPAEDRSNPCRDTYLLAERRITRLHGSRGPNFYTCEVEGWGISAPNRRRLRRLLRWWFTHYTARQACAS